MICWSCEKAAGGGMDCVHCGALQPAVPTEDYFSVLGVPRQFDVDVGALERRYRELTRKLHPDRFARADARARRASLGRSVQLNEAWRALKDPVRRAEYLLKEIGAKVAALLSGAATPTEEARVAARRELVAVRYFQRFLEEVAVHDEARATEAEGGAHG